MPSFVEVSLPVMWNSSYKVRVYSYSCQFSGDFTHHPILTKYCIALLWNSDIMCMADSRLAPSQWETSLQTISRLVCMTSMQATDVFIIWNRVASCMALHGISKYRSCCKSNGIISFTTVNTVIYARVCWSFIVKTCYFYQHQNVSRTVDDLFLLIIF